MSEEEFTEHNLKEAFKRLVAERKAGPIAVRDVTGEGYWICEDVTRAFYPDRHFEPKIKGLTNE